MSGQGQKIGLDQAFQYAAQQAAYWTGKAEALAQVRKAIVGQELTPQSEEKPFGFGRILQEG